MDGESLTPKLGFEGVLFVLDLIFNLVRMSWPAPGAMNYPTYRIDKTGLGGQMGKVG